MNIDSAASIEQHFRQFEARFCRNQAHYKKVIQTVCIDKDCPQRLTPQCYLCQSTAHNHQGNFLDIYAFFSCVLE